MTETEESADGNEPGITEQVEPEKQFDKFEKKR